MTVGMHMWDELVDGVRQQQAFLELFARGWVAEYAGSGGTVHCGRGCGGCCTLAVNATFIEAVGMARELTEDQMPCVRRYVHKLQMELAGITDMLGYLRMHRSNMGGCPLLTPDGCCGLYGFRPLSCRALISTRESRWCSADFAALPAEEKQAFVAGLDRAVVTFPTQYVSVLQETGQELEAESNRRMRQGFGFSLYGNLPVLLFLVRDYGMDQACCLGPAEVERLLEQAGVNNPLLVALER